MAVLSTLTDSTAKASSSPSKGRSPIKARKSFPGKTKKNGDHGSNEWVETSLKRKFCTLGKSSDSEEKRFRGTDDLSKSKTSLALTHPKQPVGEPWPNEELHAFDSPQDPVLREVLKARGWRQSLNPCPGVSGPQAGLCTFFAKQINPNIYARVTARPSHALWFLGKSQPRDASSTRKTEELVQVVVNHGASLSGKSGNYRLAKFPGTDSLLSDFHIADAFKNKPWFPDAFILPRDRAAALHEIRSKWDSRNNFWVTSSSPNNEEAGVRVWHGSDPKLTRMVRESDWYPRSIVHQQIADPLLIGGYKFHMHLNLVITNVSPLEAFVHENGRCVFATKPYSLSSRSLGECFDADAHIMKRDLTTKPEALDNYFKNSNGQQIRMRQLAAYLTENHPAFKKHMMWRQILDIATEVASYLSHGVLKQSHVARDRHFEVFGMDLILDKNLKVWMCNVGTESNWGYPEKEIPVSCNPDFSEEVKAFGEIYHDLFTLLGVDADNYQTQGSLNHWLKVEVP